jgi:hypothetical protein
MDWERKVGDRVVECDCGSRLALDHADKIRPYRYIARRARTSETVRADQRPPRGVAISRSLRRPAMPLALTTPSALIASSSPASPRPAPSPRA